MYKAPGSQGKTGGTGSVCDVFDEKRNPNPFPMGKLLGFSVWWGM